MEEAELSDADLSGSNLYEVEFLNATTNGIQLNGANTKMTKLAKH
jgi:uncharacterized protein YjbI with pentapeptide repeats